jgi:hypothetical protein
MSNYEIRDQGNFKFAIETSSGETIVKGLYFCQAVNVKSELEYLASIINILGEDVSVMGECYE